MYRYTLESCPLLEPPEWLDRACQAAELWPILDKDRSSVDIVIMADMIRRLRG